MSLTLTIQNLDRLDNGEPAQLKLDRHGAVIGRSPHADWSLPDPKNYISSTHCEIDFRDGVYLLIDKSTNGTWVNDAPDRVSGPHPIQDGDVIVVGHYRILARTAGGAASAAAGSSAAAARGGWDGWGDAPAAPDSAASSRWDARPEPPSPAPLAAAPPASSGWASAPEPASPGRASGWDPAPQAAAPPPASDGWGPAPAAQPAASGWDPLGAPTQPQADAWESAPASAISGRGPLAQSWSAPKAAWDAPSAQAAEDVWGRFSASNAVDWARGGFGAPAPEPPPQAAAAAPSDGDAAWEAFLRSSGVPSDLLRAGPREAAAAAGDLLRRLVAGLVVMLEARARAKAQLGAQSTTLELSGNNPLKFARSAEKVLAQLLSPPERGFMPADRAVEDSFQDLQAHQMATLAAMQGALRATVDRFSPEAIRKRAEMRGLLAKILPSARDAALWEAYQREFEGVARGSDEAFLDVFAKAFKEAYEKAAADMKRGG